MMKVLFRNRSLVIIGIAESISDVGTWITVLAIFALVVFRDDGGVLQTSGIMLAGLGPLLLASPLAGWLSDRYDRKWLMIVSQCGAGLAVIGLVFTNALPFIYAFLAIQSAFSALMLPARQSSVRDLVPDAALPRANALLQQLAGIVKIGGPIIGGAVLAVLSPHNAMLLDLASYAGAALLLLLLPALPPPYHAADQHSEQAAPSHSMLAVLRDNGQLRLLFSTTFVLVVVLMGFDLLSAVATRDVLGGSETLLGVIIGCIGLGTVAATLLLLLRAHAVDPWTDILAGLALFGILPASLAAATALPTQALAQAVVLGGCVLGGFGNGLLLVQASTLLQRLSPTGMLGRMSGLFQSSVVAGQLITMLMLPLLVPAFISIRVYCVSAAAALVVLTFWTYGSLRGARRQAVQVAVPESV